MVRVEVKVAIRKPVELVFPFVAEMENEPRWHSDAVRVRRAGEGPVGVGTTYDIEVKPFMGVSRGRARVLAFERNRLVAVESDFGAMRPRVTHRFAERGGATHLSRTVEVEMRGVMRLFALPMRAVVAKRNREFLGNLKRLLEGAGAQANAAPAGAVSRTSPR